MASIASRRGYWDNRLWAFLLQTSSAGIPCRRFHPPSPQHHVDLRRKRGFCSSGVHRPSSPSDGERSTSNQKTPIAPHDQSLHDALPRDSHRPHQLFQEWTAEPVLRPMLKFLKRTSSPLMENLYRPQTIPLEFALVTPMNSSRYRYRYPYSGLAYSNLVGSVNSASVSRNSRRCECWLIAVRRNTI